MKRRTAEGGVQMFSFLDAMICTLGALLVLLHAFARHGQIEAVRKAEEKASEQAAVDPQAERETLQWQIDQLRDIREKTEAQLADERLRLAHVEDHERRLHEKLKAAKIALAQLEKLQTSHDHDQLRTSAALEAARVRLTEAREALEEARSRGQAAATYSVVPYRGAHGTRRRPIYVECRKDLMILQPEGVEITPEDFSGYLGPGNPLASALRGTREYLARGATAADPQSAEPYPLMLVRPDGVATYYAARTALESWGTEFGYELIGEDWKLKFNEPDPRLAMLLRQIVADARMRSRELMLATAALNTHRPRTELRASSKGGFVAAGPHRGGGSGPGRAGQSRGGWDSLDSDWAGARSSARSAGRGGGQDGDGGTAASPEDASGNGLSGGRGALGDESSQGGFADEPEAGSGSGNSLVQRGPYGTAGGAYAAEQDPRGGGLLDENTRGGTGLDGHASAASSRRGAQFGTAGGDGNSQSDEAAGDARLSGLAGGTSRQGPHDRAHQGSTPRDGTGGPSEKQMAKGGSAESASRFGGSAADAGASSTSAGSLSSSGSSASSADSSGSASSQVHLGSPAHSHAAKTSSLAKTRGRDWGLPDADATQTAVTRPILVECQADRLVIVPEDRGQAPRVTRLGEEASENIDEFVAHVWQHMKSWGIAGRGLYWKPTLLVSVAPGGADRYAEIKSLLADSGLEVRERAPRIPGQAVRPAAAPRRQ